MISAIVDIRLCPGIADVVVKSGVLVDAYWVDIGEWVLVDVGGWY